jgi:hypothetical protein
MIPLVCSTSFGFALAGLILARDLRGLFLCSSLVAVPSFWVASLNVCITGRKHTFLLVSHSVTHMAVQKAVVSCRCWAASIENSPFFLVAIIPRLPPTLTTLLTLWFLFYCKQTTDAAPLPEEPADAQNATVGDTALKPGTAFYWGNYIVNQQDVLVPEAAAKGNSVIALASGADFALALRSDGQVVVWGEETVGGISNRKVPPIVTAKGATAIAAGWDYSAALLKDGQVSMQSNTLRSSF